MFGVLSHIWGIIWVSSEQGANRSKPPFFDPRDPIFASRDPSQQLRGTRAVQNSMDILKKCETATRNTQKLLNLGILTLGTLALGSLALDFPLDFPLGFPSDFGLYISVRFSARLSVRFSVIFSVIFFVD